MSVFATILTALAFRLYPLSSGLVLSCIISAVLCLIISLVEKNNQVIKLQYITAAEARKITNL
jgi:hypothetical protein